MSRFTTYPSATKPRGRNDIRMVSNVSARRKWLEKYVPEWRGPEIWSEKRVKKYIDDIKNGKGYIPVAKKAKIPWAWDCRPILQMATVVDSETLQGIQGRTLEISRRIINPVINHLDDGVYSDFL